VKNVKILVTGGFSEVPVMEKLIAENKVDFIGLGRPTILNPRLAKDILAGKLEKIPRKKLKLLDVNAMKELNILVDTYWYVFQMDCLGRGKKVDYSLGKFYVLFATYWETYTGIHEKNFVKFSFLCLTALLAYKYRHRLKKTFSNSNNKL